MLLKLATTNMYCTQLRETQSVITLKITTEAKLVSLFARVNASGHQLLDKGGILCRKSKKDVFKAVVSEKKTFVLTFYKCGDRATIAMFYGHWNAYGFPQHC